MKRLQSWWVAWAMVIICGCKDPTASGDHSSSRFKAQREQMEQHQQRTAETLNMPVVVTNSIGMKLTLIPSGVFMMGSAEPAEELRKVFGTSPEWRLFQGERPQHKVRITKAFYLGIHEVTQRQYREVMGRDPSRFKGDVRPVERVSWEDAALFCRRLSGMADCEHYRLPTEAEWEYACRAGTTTRYSCGNQLSPECAWFKKNSYSQTHPVGAKQPNAWGLYDMHGNVCEWCADWYDGNFYSRSPACDPKGPAAGSRRVMRGGCWLMSGGRCRSATRLSEEPTEDCSACLGGFRVALDLP